MNAQENVYVHVSSFDIKKGVFTSSIFYKDVCAYVSLMNFYQIFRLSFVRKYLRLEFDVMMTFKTIKAEPIKTKRVCGFV